MRREAAVVTAAAVVVLLVLGGLLLSGLFRAGGDGAAGSPSAVATPDPASSGTASPSPSPSPSATAAPVAGPPELEWRTLPSPQDGAFVAGVEFLNGTWFALGAVERAPMIWASSDAESWQAATLESTLAPNEGAVVGAIAIVGNTLIATGSWGIENSDQSAWIVWRSEDAGSTWQESRESHGSLRALIAGGPGYVGAAWDFGGTSPPARSWIALSDDGDGWTRIDDDSFERASIFTLARLGDRLVAAGASSSPDGLVSRAAVWVSDDDGESWEPIQPGAEPFEIPNASILDLAVGPSDIVAIGHADFSQPLAWVSQDGTAWERVEMGGTGRAEVVAALRGLVAVGHAPNCGDSPNLAWISADGSQWEPPTEIDVAAVLCPTDAAASDTTVLVSGRCEPQPCDASFLRGDLVED